MEFSPKYDDYIKKYSEFYLKEYDIVFGYQLLKAQLYQESLLNTYAVSKVNAKGLGQFMTKTWGDMIYELNYPKNASPFDPELNIKASAYYMSKLLRQWHVKRSIVDKYSFALASYNLGLGNTLKAQKRCNNSITFNELYPCLPKETRIYVPRIWNIYFRMKYLDV